MEELYGRSIMLLRLHAGVHIQGVGNLNSLIDVNNYRGKFEVSIKKVEDGAYLSFKNPEGFYEAFIPNGNIQSAQFFPK